MFLSTLSVTNTNPQLSPVDVSTTLCPSTDDSTLSPVDVSTKLDDSVLTDTSLTGTNGQ